MIFVFFFELEFYVRVNVKFYDMFKINFARLKK